MLDVLDAAATRRWGALAVTLLDEHRREIDALNVFPVPDADTGSNTLTTVRAGADDVETLFADDADPAAPASAEQVLDAFAGGAATAALGNSGFIVSQVLRGLADAAATSRLVDARTVARGLAVGAGLAREAVVRPVEGTILTVADAAAQAAAEAADAPGSLADVVRAAVRAADAALQRTPDQLNVLAEAGVVDAGGRALVLVLDALAHVVTGSSAGVLDVQAPTASSPSVGIVTTTPAEHRATPSVAVATSEHVLGFEVQYLLDAEATAIEPLRAALASGGDSVAIVNTGSVGTGPQTWKVHVHVADGPAVGLALDAGLQAGRPSGISVVPLTTGADTPPLHDRPAGETAVLAVAPGAGLAHLFESEGVHVVEGGADDLPEGDAVHAAILDTGAAAVVLLPNASRVTGVAEAAADQARHHGLRVAVVPTRSPVQGLAAIAVHDAARRFDDDVVAMAEAAAATRWAELYVARDRALTAVGICEPGDILGLIDGEVVEIGHGLLAVAFNVVDRLVAVGAELITVLIGRDAPRRAGELIEAHVRGRSPFTDVTVYPGGQPDSPVIIGVE